MQQLPLLTWRNHDPGERIARANTCGLNPTPEQVTEVRERITRGNRAEWIRSMDLSTPNPLK